LLPLSLSAGSRLSGTEMESLAGQWIDPASPDRAYDSDFPQEGHCCYTPMTGWAGTWTVGHCATLSRVPDPTDLAATRSGAGLGSSTTVTRVNLRWCWPPQASACLVVAREGAPPQGPSDPAAITVTVSRSDYDRQGCWMLNLSLPWSQLPGGPAVSTA